MTAAAMVIPTIAPVDRCCDGPGEPDVEVAVTVAVDVKRAGSGRVGGILMLAHMERFVDWQQNAVALGDSRPQYVHSWTRFDPKPQFCGSFTSP